MATARKSSSGSRSRSHGRSGGSKRELVNTGRDKRYVRRNAKGEFKESDDVGRSLSQDRKKHAKTVAAKGQGDRGDQRRK